MTVFDKSARSDGTFSREAFTYDHTGDIYRYPGGKTLTTTGTPVNDDRTILYRASKHDCQACSLKSRCCPNIPTGKVPRSIYEGARDMAREVRVAGHASSQEPVAVIPDRSAEPVLPGAKQTNYARYEFFGLLGEPRCGPLVVGRKSPSAAFVWRGLAANRITADSLRQWI